MEKWEKQLTALLRLCAAETEEERKTLRRELRQLLQGMGPARPTPEGILRQLLLEMGVPDHLVGHAYLVRAVVLLVEDSMYIRNITFGLYPQVAAQLDTTAGRVERAIRNLIEVTWARGNEEVLNCYFGNIVTSEKAKPTNSEFIARLANLVKAKMREAA